MIRVYLWSFRKSRGSLRSTSETNTSLPKPTSGRCSKRPNSSLTGGAAALVQDFCGFNSALPSKQQQTGVCFFLVDVCC